MDIYKKIFKVQSELKPVIKDAENPYFKSNYATLNAVLEVLLPLLQKNNLTVLQPPISSPEGLGVKTIIADADGPDVLEFPFYLPVGKQTAQEGGSCITYARRYALNAIFGMTAADDDGNASTDGSNVYYPNDDEIRTFASYLDHDRYTGKKNDVKKWWAGLKTEQQVANGLAYMKKQIQEHEAKHE